MSVFNFYTRLNLVMLLGIRADNVPDLLEGIRNVLPASIYFHTHRFLAQQQAFTTGQTNDFTYWVTSFLNLLEPGESEKE
jgi:hypothetical protein